MPEPVIETRVAGVALSASNSVNALIRALASGCYQEPLPKRTPRLLILLVTKEWCAPEHEFLAREIRHELKRQTGQTIPLVGASMGRIFCSAPEPKVICEGAVLCMVCTEHLRAVVGGLPSPYQVDETTRRGRLRALAQELKMRLKDGTSLGTSANTDLFAFLPGCFLNSKGEREYLDTEMADNIREAFDFKHSLFGASATTEVYPRVPDVAFTFANDSRMASGLSLALVETDLRIGSSMEHGFRPASVKRVSVDEVIGDLGSGSPVVQKLDNTPARIRLDQLRSQAPFGGAPVFGLPSGDDFHCLLPVGMRQDDSLVLTRKVQLGDQLYLLEAAPSQIQDAGLRALNNAITLSGAHRGGIEIVLSFACAGRFRQTESADRHWQQAVAFIADTHPGIPVIVGLSGGEFGQDRWRRERAGTMCIVVLCIGRERNWRARNQALRQGLLVGIDRMMTENASRTAGASLPRRIMEVALDGAIEVGAKGGMICFVNWKRQRILGKKAGLARVAQGSTQNWELALSETDRSIPPVGGPSGVPLDFRDDSAAVCPPLSNDLNPIAGDAIDILALAVKTGHAILVRDTLHDKYCVQGLCDRANIPTMIVIPLPGSDGRPFGTLQLGFPFGEQLDREAIECLVEYARILAVALDRALDKEERETGMRIQTMALELMRGPAPLVPVPVRVIQRFVDKVRVELNLSYCHARLERTPMSGRFELVASEGSLAIVHKQVRPVLSLGDGSCDPGLSADGLFLDTADEVARRSAAEGQVPLSDTVPQQAASLWQEFVRTVHASAHMPLRSENDDFLGMLICDSDEEYFFDDRLRRLVRVAAEALCSLLAHLRESFVREQQREQRDQLSNLNALLDALTLRTVTEDMSAIVDSYSQIFDDITRELATGEPSMTEEAPERVQAAYKHLQRELRAQAKSVCHFEPPDPMIIEDVEQWLEKEASLQAPACHDQRITIAVRKTNSLLSLKVSQSEVRMAFHQVLTSARRALSVTDDDFAGGRIVIGCEPSAVPQCVDITVEDNGPGFPPNFSQGSFSQADARDARDIATQVLPNRGRGGWELYVARRMMAAIGGTIKLDSPASLPGGGPGLRVTLCVPSMKLNS